MEVSMSKTRRGKYTDNRICYISKCKGDMRLYLRRKGKLPCFSYLVRGKSFSFYRGKIRFFVETSKNFPQLFPRYSPIFPNPAENGNGKSRNIWKTHLLLITFAYEINPGSEKEAKTANGETGK